MKLLLDTHIWIWSLDNPKKLNPRVVNALRNPRNEIWLSPISVWEAVLLIDRGRLRLKGKFNSREWVSAALARAPMKEATLNHEVAIRSVSVQVEHDDPADRFLAATAEVYDLTLVTADERLLGGNGFRTLGNR